MGRPKGSRGIRVKSYHGSMLCRQCGFPVRTLKTGQLRCDRWQCYLYMRPVGSHV